MTVDGSSEIWGCVNPWSGGVSWMQSSGSACNGQAMLFDTGPEYCRSYANPLAADKLDVAPTC
ncbi:MAG: hypothetical protein R2849_14945 [Thermomicrobiales bacterium]